MVKLKFLRIFINVTIENKILYNLEDMIIYLFFKKEIPFILIKDVEKAKTVITKLKIHQNHRHFIQNILAKERSMLI